MKKINDDEYTSKELAAVYFIGLCLVGGIAYVILLFQIPGLRMIPRDIVYELVGIIYSLIVLLTGIYGLRNLNSTYKMYPKWLKVLNIFTMISLCCALIFVVIAAQEIHKQFTIPTL